MHRRHEAQSLHFLFAVATAMRSDSLWRRENVVTVREVLGRSLEKLGFQVIFQMIIGGMRSLSRGADFGSAQKVIILLVYVRRKPATCFPFLMRGH